MTALSRRRARADPPLHQAQVVGEGGGEIAEAVREDAPGQSSRGGGDRYAQTCV